MLTYEDIFRDTPINELYRIMSSNKDYVAMLHHGYSYTSIVLTNNSLQFEKLSSDELILLTCISYELRETIKDMLIEKCKDINIAWGKQCHYTSLKSFLEAYNITEYKYRQLLALSSNL